MIIKINLRKNKFYNIKIDNKLLFIFIINNKINNNNISISSYNYFLLLKILRNFGLLNPIYNKKNYNYK